MKLSYGDLFDAVASAVRPNDPAVYCDEATLTWGEFDRSSNALARALVAAGLKRGAKVAQYLRNGPEYLVAVAAAFKARLVPVNVNFRYGPDELVYLLDNCDAEAVVFDAEFAGVVSALRPRLPKVKRWASVGGPVAGATTIEALSIEDASPLAIERSADDMMLLYTGGTTGLPKGVMWPSGTLCEALAASRAPGLGREPPATVEALQAQLRAGVGRDPIYVATPLMHGTGLFSALAALTRAAPVVLTRRASFDPRAALDAITRLRCGGLTVVGDAFARPLLDALRSEPTRYDITCLRAMVSSGMMWSADVKAGLLEFMPNAMLLDSLGSSEAGGLGVAVASRDAPVGESRFESPDTKVVRADGFAPVVPGSGEVGLVVKRGVLPLGYYKDPERTARTYVTIDGQRHVITGDHASVEIDGSIKLLGRGSHCINSGGEKIYPEEVEEALKSHAAVLDALVFGMPDPRFGQSINAVVSLVAGVAASDAELIAHVRRRLAAYKAPRRIAFSSSAPRGPSGKADYSAAKAIFARAFEV